MSPKEVAKEVAKRGGQIEWLKCVKGKDGVLCIIRLGIVTDRQHVQFSSQIRLAGIISASDRVKLLRAE